VSSAGRFGDGGSSASDGGSAGAAGKAGSAGSGGHSGAGGNGGSAGSSGAGGSVVVDEYPEPRAAYSRYSEGGINVDPGIRSPAITQPETSASNGLWLMSSSLQFFRSSFELRHAFWAGEVKNFGTEPLCDVSIKVAFTQSNDAVPRHEASAKLEGEQRVTTGGERIFCVLPGAIVPAYSAIQIADNILGGKIDAAEVSWQIDGTGDAAVDPLMPTVVLEKLSGFNDEWGVQVQLMGAAAGVTQALHHSVYLGFGDFLEFPLTSNHLEPLAAGEAWEFFSGTLKAPTNAKARFRSSLSFAPSP